MSENPRASAVPQRPGDSKSHNRGQQNYHNTGGYRKKSRGGRTPNYSHSTQNVHYATQNFDQSGQFNNVQHAPGAFQQPAFQHFTAYHHPAPQHIATGTSYGTIQHPVRGAVATNGIAETNGEVDKSQGVPTSMPTNGYINHNVPMSHVNYQNDPYRATVTSTVAGDMAAAQPQYLYPQYVQNSDPNVQHQQIAYQNVQYPQGYQIDAQGYPYTGQAVYQPIHLQYQQPVHYQAQVGVPQQQVYYNYSTQPQYYAAPQTVDPNMVPQQVMPVENGNLVASSPVVHIQNVPPSDQNVNLVEMSNENMEPMQPTVAANSANESESYAAHPVSVTFGQLADPNSLASEQLTTIESEPANEEAASFEKIEVENEIVEKEEEVEIKEENEIIENEEKTELEEVEENCQETKNEQVESTTISDEERMVKRVVEEQQPVLNPNPATWEKETELFFMQEDSESDECEHENLVKGIHELSFQPSEQLDAEGSVPEKCETATDLPANTEYNYKKTIKSPIVNTKVAKKNQVQKVTKIESEEKQVQNEKTAQKVAKSPVQIAPKKEIIKTAKKENQDKTVAQPQSEKKYDVTRPCRTLTVSPVGISAALKDQEPPKRRPALPQADPRGTSSGPRPSPKVPVEVATPPKAFSWASVASKGQKQVKQSEKSRPSKEQNGPNGDVAKAPVQSNVDPAALQISSILDGPNKEMDSSGVPRGLINQANSCWVNSILQTALVCDPLYHLLCKLLKYTSNSNGESQNTKEIARIGAEIKRMLPTCAKLAEVFDQIVVNKGGMAYEAKDIYGHISTLNPTISVGQQDAEEGLSLLLNAMHDEIVALKKAAGINTKANQAVTSAGEGWQVSGRQRAFAVATSATGSAFDETPISAGFRGISQSSIKLPSHQSPPPTEEPFFTLKVEVPPPPVPGSEKAISIEECLRLTPKEETLDEYRLKTGQSVTATRKVSLAALPPFLILHMKRFQFNPRTLEVKKIDRKVTVRERITIEPYLQSPALREQTRGGVDYELRGMVLHHGISAEGGHYTAEVKRGTKWYRIDDNRVSEMKLSEVLHADSRRTPYLLLWARL